LRHFSRGKAGLPGLEPGS